MAKLSTTKTSKTTRITNKAAIYVRVSTEEQAKEGYSLAAQEQALKDHAKLLGYETHKIYKDEGKSAKDMHRPAMQQMLKDAEKHQFSAIIVYKLDRFSRSLKDLILTIEQLKKINVDFISMQDRIETASASGKLMFHIISSFAEFERDIISERTRFGMKEKAKEGGIVSKAPLGYKIHEGKLVLDTGNAEKVRIIFKQFLESKDSLNKIARKYNLTVRGLIKILMNRTYIGEIKFKETYTGQHELLIDKELFNKVQEKIASTRQDRNITKYTNILQKITDNKELIAQLIVPFSQKELYLEEKQLPEGDLKNVITELLSQEGFSEDEIFNNRVYINADKPWISAINEDRKVYIEQDATNLIHYLEQNIEVWIVKEKVYVIK
ncbi:MAG: recombinase family protein [Candidatus Woesearchaeota archaeon]